MGGMTPCIPVLPPLGVLPRNCTGPAEMPPSEPPVCTPPRICSGTYWPRMGLSDPPWPLVASTRPGNCGVRRRDGFNEDSSLTPPCSGPERLTAVERVWALPFRGAREDEGADEGGVDGA